MGADTPIDLVGRRVYQFRHTPVVTASGMVAPSKAIHPLADLFIAALLHSALRSPRATVDALRNTCHRAASQFLLGL